MSRINRKCFVPNCKSGYKSVEEKVTLFGVPKDQNLFKQWEKNIQRLDRALSARDVVCEKHFLEEYVIRGIKLSSGEFYPYARLKLASNAVPTVFQPCFDTECPDNSPKILNYQGNDNILPPKIRKISQDNAQPGPFTSTTEILIQNSTTLSLEEQNLKRVIFEKLYNRQVSVTFPSSSWNTTSSRENENKYVVFSEIIVLNGSPINQKSIVLNERLEVSYFCKNKQINLQHYVKCINDINDLQEILMEFGTLNLCPGGPNESEFNVKVEFD